MLKKTQSAGTGKSKVTFVLSSEPNADHVHVAGDFNDWQASSPMKRQKDGSWRATLELEPGREYQFRYLVDGNHWVNDEAADAYWPNPFGADNSVVRTPEGSGTRRSGSSRPAARRGKGGEAGGTRAKGAPGGKGSAGGAASGAKRTPKQSSGGAGGSTKASGATSGSGKKGASAPSTGRQNGSHKPSSTGSHPQGPRPQSTGE